MKDKKKEFKLFMKELDRIDLIVQDQLGLDIKTYDISKNPKIKVKGKNIFPEDYHKTRSGCYLSLIKSIWLNGRLKTKFMKEVLIHEITHAFFHQKIGRKTTKLLGIHGKEFQEVQRYYKKIFKDC